MSTPPISAKLLKRGAKAGFVGLRGRWAIVVFCIVFMSLASVTSLGAAPETNGEAGKLFTQSNQAYDEGRYEEAVRGYEQLIRNGFASGPVYYNLGNCYFKLNQLGQAILQYERARRLMPADASLEANYNFALKTAGVDNSPRSRLDRLAGWISDRFTPDGLAALAAAFFILLMLALNLRLWLRRREITAGGGADVPPRSALLRSILRRAIPAAAVLTVSLAAVFGWIAAREDLRDHGVVLSGEAEVRYEPRSEATVFFTLKEGSEVGIDKASGGWLLVQRPDGKRGWVEENEVGVI